MEDREDGGVRTERMEDRMSKRLRGDACDIKSSHHHHEDWLPEHPGHHEWRHDDGGIVQNDLCEHCDGDLLRREDKRVQRELRGAGRELDGVQPF